MNQLYQPFCISRTSLSCHKAPTFQPTQVWEKSELGSSPLSNFSNALVASYSVASLRSSTITATRTGLTWTANAHPPEQATLHSIGCSPNKKCSRISSHLCSPWQVWHSEPTALLWQHFLLPTKHFLSLVPSLPCILQPSPPLPQDLHEWQSSPNRTGHSTPLVASSDQSCSRISSHLCPP